MEKREEVTGLEETDVPGLDPGSITLGLGVLNAISALTGRSGQQAEEYVREALEVHRGEVADPVTAQGGTGKPWRPYQVGPLTVRVRLDNQHAHTVEVAQQAALAAGLGERLHPDHVEIPYKILVAKASEWDLSRDEAREELKDMLRSAATHPVPEVDSAGNRRYIVGKSLLLLDSTHTKLTRVRDAKLHSDLPSVPVDSTQVHVDDSVLGRMAALLHLPADDLQVVEDRVREIVSAFDGEYGADQQDDKGWRAQVHAGKRATVVLGAGNRRLLNIYLQRVDEDAVQDLDPAAVQVTRNVTTKLLNTLRLDGEGLGESAEHERATDLLRSLLAPAKGEATTLRDGRYARQHRGPKWDALASADNQTVFAFRYPLLDTEHLRLTPEAAEEGAEVLGVAPEAVEGALKEALQRWEGHLPQVKHKSRKRTWMYYVQVGETTVRVFLDKDLDWIVQVLPAGGTQVD